MLTKVAIRKRFDEVEVELGNPVLFVGPNDAGKTSALQALMLWDLGLRRWTEKRGGKTAPEKRPGVAISRRDLTGRSHSISACRAEVLPASLGPTKRTGFPSSTSTSSKRLKFRMATFVSIALAYGAGLGRCGRGAAACENT